MRSTDHLLEIYKDKKIAIIAGGISSEKEISFRSANNVKKALDRLGIQSIILNPIESSFFSTDFDIAFNCLHGKWGEDGCIQGYCEMKKIPYTGPSLLATSIGLNKPIFKEIINGLGIITPKTINKNNPKFPMIVKPIAEGSSIGISIINSLKEWQDLIELKPEVLGNNYFCENYIKGKELTSGVIEINGEVIVLPILEIQTSNEFYDYDGKYTAGKSNLIVPADINDSISKNIQDLSKKIYKYFNCKGCIRIDIMMDNDIPSVLEMNTCPGLTELSDIPAQAQALGISFESLVLHLLSSAKL